MHADLRPQLALNPRHRGRTSASNCHSPGSADMLDTFTSRPHTRHNHATAATRRCPISVPLAPPAHTSRAAIHPLQPATQHYGQPNSSSTSTTTHTPQPSLHNHQSIPLTSTGTHPTPTPNRPTPQPTQTPSGQADSALQTEYTHKLPVSQIATRSERATSRRGGASKTQQRHTNGASKSFFLERV